MPTDRPRLATRPVRSSAVWSIAAALALGACGAARSGGLEALQRQPTAAYRGHYTIGPDGSWFRPCGAAAEEPWWVTVTGASVGQLDSARRAGQLREGQPSFVAWQAWLTRGGEIGPKGPGHPALLVRTIDAVRPAGRLEADCAAR